MDRSGKNRLDSRHAPALGIALRYASFGAIWIVGSDRLLLLISHNADVQAALQTAKGWLFIAVTAALLYGLVFRELDLRVELRRAADEERDRQEALLRKSLAERETLIGEVHHRVRNNLQVMDSLLNLERRREPDGSADAGLERLRARIRAMGLVHDQLYRTGDLERIDAAAYVDALVGSLEPPAGRRALRLENACGALRLSLDEAVPFGLALTELATNALAYAAPGAAFRVEALDEGPLVRVKVRDEGAGFPPELLAGQRTEREAMGLELVRTLARQLGGVASFRNDGGAVVEFAIARRSGDSSRAP